MTILVAQVNSLQPTHDGVIFSVYVQKRLQHGKSFRSWEVDWKRLVWKQKKIMAKFYNIRPMLTPAQLTFNPPSICSRISNQRLNEQNDTLWLHIVELKALFSIFNSVLWHINTNWVCHQLCVFKVGTYQTWFRSHLCTIILALTLVQLR